MPLARFQFSIRWMFIAIALFSVLGSHIFTSWKLKQARDEIGRMARELGQLVVSDPSKLYVAAIRGLDDMTWRWRVHVPENTNYQLRIASQKIPLAGFPTSFGTMGFPAGDYVLTAGIRRDHLGQWKLTIMSPTSSMGLGILDAGAAWLLDSPGYSTEQAGTDGSTTAPSGAAFVLLRVRSMEKNPGGAANTDQPCDGIMIWMDEP